ncbi:hypothetical protein N7471_010745, partial [Penicillium samsonianum]|uniref:uncharacterized protein n=1 Tax=Penicillium samsonianum TaxID=1882272 RepID=UPI002546CC10
RHPLPARPPSEVCLDDGLHSDAQTTRHEPEWAASPALTLRPSTLKTFHNCRTYGAPKISILLQYTIMFVWVLSIDPPVLDRATWTLPLLLTFPGNKAIDLAILSDHDCPDSEHIQSTENITSIATYQGECPSNCSRFPNQDLSFQRRRQNAKETADHDRQSLKGREMQKIVPIGPLEGLDVERALHVLPFVPNSRPFQLKTGYSSYLGCLRVLYHTAFLRVPTQMPPLYQDPFKSWTSPTTIQVQTPN